MENYVSLSRLPHNQTLKAGDLFVLFGELFGRGYANGLVQNAKARGLQVIGLTMGRREKGELRPLNPEELSAAETLLGGKIINIPLEAGFDMENTSKGSVVEMLAGVKIETWEDFKVDFGLVDDSVELGERRFRSSVQQVLSEVEKYWRPGQNVVFAHTMAGGIPRAKIMLVIANRVFKGRGERYIHSGRFWNSDLGRLTSRSFDTVTAQTFQNLLELSRPFREKVKKSGGKVCYSAYGYHGNKILVGDKYQWQTYTPYQQGHAKKKLEHFAHQAQKEGIPATVFNCPEIRTNSSDIFLGVELSLFPMLYAFEKEGEGQWIKDHYDLCQSKLKPGEDLHSLLKKLNSYFDNSVMKDFIHFEKWPMENSAELAELMVGTSEYVTGLHQDRKDLISDHLSSLVIEATGKLIFESLGESPEAALWLGHEWVAKQLAANQH